MKIIAPYGMPVVSPKSINRFHLTYWNRLLYWHVETGHPMCPLKDFGSIPAGWLESSYESPKDP